MRARVDGAATSDGKWRVKTTRGEPVVCSVVCGRPAMRRGGDLMFVGDAPRYRNRAERSANPPGDEHGGRDAHHEQHHQHAIQRDAVGNTTEPVLR